LSNRIDLDKMKKNEITTESVEPPPINTQPIGYLRDFRNMTTTWYFTIFK